ncbi:type I glutamate--ammonia ligase [Gimesia maris]|uniref:Glutamine synthetase n=1 Tax=Gimesia maris TaxID=122 RepID=A0ABX5YG65_9PLAN|nr:type I glutamate--ammonia ligase [Gimesia maris]EDL57651.1 glutamine synthetase, type I [Gimesia maris DSM 8797]QDT77142.1 Glutamine synthetase [Gimesia maris]QDU12784.1 Glutamine synthetase [Gimesia maris]QEG14717.1 Glutamine synthetase [Gimesia maris]QGQ31887.1 type I glutamate--ammonia ligase [Gimesia maris]
MTPREVLALCREREIQAVDLRFMDFPGTQKHFTIPAKILVEKSFEDGFGFDGSSMRGWKAINESDMLVVPQPDTAFVDPFMSNTLVMTCNIQDPITREDYAKDPRNVARKAESYMRSTKIADVANFGPEAEFFIFDDVRFDQNEHECYYHVDSIEGQWNRGKAGSTQNAGYKIRHKEGYFPVPPADTLQEVRTEMMLAMMDCGVDVEAQHHEVATAGQCEIDMKYAPLLKTADNLLRYKYIVKNVAVRHGKTATFMPKPLWNDNGSGLHLHMSLWKEGKPLFAGSRYGGLSEMGMYAMGGILKHAPALFAFCCPTTNSYKRLIAGFEAPINLTYSYRNRSAAIRIPVHSPHPENKRFEFRCPDSSSNPYLAMSAVLMAMLDGIQNKIDPGHPLEKDIYDLKPDELAELPSVPDSLEHALQALRDDHKFLLTGDVFTEDVIDTWIWYKTNQEVAALRERPHPYEFAMYYDI